MKPGNAQILLVEDDIDVLEALADALTEEGYSIAVAHDGVEALEKLRSGLRPSLILIDSVMPRCDGPSFRRQQKADAELLSIPVVLVTGDVRAHEMSGDFDACLRKPVVFKELLTVVAAHGSRDVSCSAHQKRTGSSPTKPRRIS